MSLNKDPREYIWALPILGGVIGIISLFTPAHHAYDFGISTNVWMWGLYNRSAPDYSEIGFIYTVYARTDVFPLQYTLSLFLSGLIPAILILISSITLTVSSNAVRTGKRDIKKFVNVWIGMGIMMIVASIIYIIAIDIAWMNLLQYIYRQSYPPEAPTFWDTFDPGYAVIAPFLGASLSIVGSIASKTMKPRELPIFSIQKQGNIITKIPKGEISRKIKFCFGCGHQLLYDEARFCQNCGKATIEI